MYASGETTLLGTSGDSKESPFPIEASESNASYLLSAQTSESITSIEYSINTLYTIISGDNNQNVDIAKYDLPTRYKHYSVRKLDKDGFLAEICDWKQLNLIPGNASVFYENRYVEKAYLNPFRIDNKLEVSLGVDKSIPVSRVKKVGKYRIST